MSIDPSRRTHRPERGRWRPGRTLALLALLASGFAGCGEDATEVLQNDQPEYDGLSRDQIENRAESMTPAEAEALGIIDTTIRIVPPMNPDSVVPLDVPQVIPADTGAR